MGKISDVKMNKPWQVVSGTLINYTFGVNNNAQQTHGTEIVYVKLIYYINGICNVKK